MSAFPASRQADASDDSHQRGQRSRPDVGVIGRKEEEGDIVERGGGLSAPPACHFTRRWNLLTVTTHMLWQQLPRRAGQPGGRGWFSDPLSTRGSQVFSLMQWKSFELIRDYVCKRTMLETKVEMFTMTQDSVSCHCAKKRTGTWRGIHMLCLWTNHFTHHDKHK